MYTDKYNIDGDERDEKWLHSNKKKDDKSKD